MKPFLSKFYQLHYLVFLLSVSLSVLPACSVDLPEPESRGAQLYVSYCSSKGCHAALPPERGGKRYWDIQYNRMLEVMAQQNKTRPTAEETKEILAYLQRYARSNSNND